MDKRALATIVALLTATMAQADIATVDGHDVYYEVHGDLTPDMTPILMLHGAMMNIASSFGEMIPELVKSHPVIGVEQQGHGHTPLNEAPISLESMRLDTLGVLDALSVDRAHVVGFSAGGILGLELAVNAPDRVASLTAISASAGPEGFLPDIIAMQREPGFRPSPEVAALMPTPEDFAQMSADIARMNPGGAETTAGTMQKMSQFMGSDWGWSDAQLAGIAVPTLLVIGDTDFIMPEHALRMAQTIPDAWLAVLPATTHLNILGQPELLPMIERRISNVEDTSDR